MKRLASWSDARLGLAFVLIVVALTVLSYAKQPIMTALSSGETIVAEFNRGYRLVPNHSDVKIAGSQVGVVTDVAAAPNGASRVSMKLDDDALAIIGSEPAATIRPATLLGGKYYVDLKPGGEGTFEGEAIPRSRTSTPVELDRVLATFPSSARDGMRTAIEQYDRTLRNGGKDALRNLVRHAPATLRPARDVLHASLGTRPETDLTTLVRGMRTMAHAFTQEQGQLDAIMRDAARSTAAFAEASQPIADAIDTMPETLARTRAGLADLQPTLDRIPATSRDALPSVKQLDTFLTAADPVLADTRPLVMDVPPLLHDLRPAIEQLVPATQQATGVFNDVRGPVLNRVNGPLLHTVMSPWKGSGPYAGGGDNGHRLYEELGYLTARAANLSKYHNANGESVSLQAGAGTTSVVGTPISLEQLIRTLSSGGGTP